MMQFLEKLGSGLMATEPLTHIQRNGRRYSDQAQALLKRNTGEIVRTTLMATEQA